MELSDCEIREALRDKSFAKKLFLKVDDVTVVERNFVRKHTLTDLFYIWVESGKLPKKTLRASIKEYSLVEYHYSASGALAYHRFKNNLQMLTDIVAHNPMLVQWFNHLRDNE